MMLHTMASIMWGDAYDVSSYVASMNWGDAYDALY